MKKSKLIAPDTGEWTAVSWWQLVNLTSHPAGGWRWEEKNLDGRKRLTLLKPDGSRLLFKLHGGAYVRPWP